MLQLTRDINYRHKLRRRIGSYWAKLDFATFSLYLIGVILRFAHVSLDSMVIVMKTLMRVLIYRNPNNLLSRTDPILHQDISLLHGILLSRTKIIRAHKNGPCVRVCV